MALTAKQEKFAQLVAGGADELDAIKQVGYKASGATKQAYRMTQNEAVQNRIAELKAVRVIQRLDSAENVKKDKGADPIRPDYSQATAKKLKALDFLNSVYSDPTQEMKARISAAVAALPYEQAKIAQKGKKENEKDTATAQATSGKWATLSNQADFFESGTIS